MVYVCKTNSSNLLFILFFQNIYWSIVTDHSAPEGPDWRQMSYYLIWIIFF